MNNALYKGYILTRNKQSLQKLQGVKTFKTYEEVMDAPEFAGVLQDDVILIDIDDMDKSEIMMNIVEDMQLNCRVYQTKRGRHFVFKNSNVKTCGTKKKLACGLEADIKIGGKNTYEVIKFDGEERFIEWDSDNGQYDELPKWMNVVKSNVKFDELEEGDGRNSALYGYILTLTNAGFGRDESRECIRIINKYILPKALTDDELEVILRDDAFPEDTFYNGRTFLHNNFAVFMMNNDNIKRVNGQLCCYKEGVYVGGRREIEALMIQHIPTLKDAQRSEVLKYLEILCAENHPMADANFIAFNNGIYDIATDELKDFSPDIVCMNKIPWDFNREAYSELMDNTLNKIACSDNSIRMLLEEATGYCFYKRNELSKAFFLTGEGANGKSTFLDVVKHVLGKDNTCALDLNELDERFSAATMLGKLANIADDISDDFLQGSSIANLKKVVSGNEIKAEFKGQDAFFFEPYLKVFVSANNLPRTKSSGFAALKRRLVIIPFNAKFTKDDPDYDPYITWKLRSKECMEYMIQLGIAGLKRILENKGFTASEKVEKEIKDYEIDNNPILLFLTEHEPDTLINRECKEVHRQYKVFCAENGFIEMTLNNFTRELNKKAGIVTKRMRVDGTLYSYYVQGDIL